MPIQDDEQTPLLGHKQAAIQPDGRDAAINNPGASSLASPSPLDPEDLDARLTRWIDHIKNRFRLKPEKTPLETTVQFIVTVFGPEEGDPPLTSFRIPQDHYVSDGDFTR